MCVREYVCVCVCVLMCACVYVYVCMRGCEKNSNTVHITNFLFQVRILWPMTRATMILTLWPVFWSCTSVGWKTPSFLRKGLTTSFRVSVSRLSSSFLLKSFPNRILFLTNFLERHCPHSPAHPCSPPMSEAICLLPSPTWVTLRPVASTLGWADIASECPQLS